MTYRDKLFLFNSYVLLNKIEILESFDDFVSHHKEKNNEEGYSEGKRKVLLSLCEQFRNELINTDIPSQTKNWLYYEYSVTNDSLELSLYKCDDIEFDEDDEISSMSYTQEYTLVKVKCDNLTVEQYAEQYGVTSTTVRQWIRRGKLRTAKKNGRDWLIPALADNPKRGFQSVSYYWDLLPLDLIDKFSYLSDCNYIYIYQDEINKNVFYCITGFPGADERQKIELTSKERESLELALISTASVTAEDLDSGVRFVPAKNSFSLPVLSTNKELKFKNNSNFSDIIVQPQSQDKIAFSLYSEVGDFLEDEYPRPYLIPINWEFYGAPAVCEDAVYEALDNDFNRCVKIGTLSGQLIICSQMYTDGYDPFIVCDDESADLGYIMSILTGEGGPLNDLTGDSMQDVLYINELIIEESLRRHGLGTRILQELPYICKRLLLFAPDIISYYVQWEAECSLDIKNDESSNHKDNKYDHFYEFYKSNGFQKFVDNHLLYTFTNM